MYVCRPTDPNLARVGWLVLQLTQISTLEMVLDSCYLHVGRVADVGLEEGTEKLYKTLMHPLALK